MSAFSTARFFQAEQDWQEPAHGVDARDPRVGLSDDERHRQRPERRRRGRRVEPGVAQPVAQVPDPQAAREPAGAGQDAGQGQPAQGAVAQQRLRQRHAVGGHAQLAAPERLPADLSQVGHFPRAVADGQHGRAEDDGDGPPVDPRHLPGPQRPLPRGSAAAAAAHASYCPVPSLSPLDTGRPGLFLRRVLAGPTAARPSQKGI